MYRRVQFYFISNIHLLLRSSSASSPGSPGGLLKLQANLADPTRKRSSSSNPPRNTSPKPQSKHILLWKIFFHPTTTTMLLVTSWVEMVVVVMLVGPYQIVACLLPFGSISQLLLPLPLLLLLRLIVHHESHKMSLSNPPPGSSRSYSLWQQSNKFISNCPHHSQLSIWEEGVLLVTF